MKMEKTIAPSFGTSRDFVQGRKAISSRLVPLFLFTTAVMGLLWYRHWTISRLGNESFSTGYVLLATCIGLIALGGRKRLQLHAIGGVAVWQSMHHYMGTYCLIAYSFHAGVITTGWFESLLAVLFWTILLSGFLSWYVNKTSPKKLRVAGAAILRSDIPLARIQVSEQAYQIALEAAGSNGAMAIADYYRSDLSTYFAHSRTLWYRLLPTGRKKRALIAGLDRLDRYLDAKGRELQSRLGTLIREKDDLDFQSAIQHRMRFCAVFHTLLLGAFVLLAVAHILLAHQYSSHW